MHSINTAKITEAIQIPCGDGVSIASLGDDNVFASMKMRYLGTIIELVVELSIYHPISGATDTEEVARRICDDEDDAIGAATDLERAAIKRLNELDVVDTYADPDGFGEALEAHLDRVNARAIHVIAAE